MPSVINKKAQWNIYTVLLIIALVSLFMACLFLLLEIYSYGGFGAYSGALSSATTPLADRGIQYLC